MRTRSIAQAGVIGAVYAALTLVVIQSPLGYGPVQFRLSEAVTVVACLTPAAIPGLWIGTAVANAYLATQFGVLALLDVVFGSVASLLGAVWAWRHRGRPGIALAGPVVANALIVPAYLPLMLSGLAGLDYYRIPALGVDASGAWWAMYLFGVVAVGFGQAVVVYGLGLPLLRLLKRLGAERILSGGSDVTP
ncbi:MAG: QueT transporter family protein [Coriobacteriia bacterium]|nr:QueT transporter family protein [Actinomycetota bacterium]MDZ4166936.1 QueT transporter family protein [Coriobacteriia bacterium]